MWERITVALAELGPAALAVSEEQRGGGAGEPAAEPASEEDLVQYEGMLISVAAAQRRRCEATAWLLLDFTLGRTSQKFTSHASCAGSSLALRYHVQPDLTRFSCTDQTRTS